MTTEDRKEAIRYINSQLEYGYIDLGAHDTDEIEIIKEAMALLNILDTFVHIDRINVIDDEKVIASTDDSNNDKYLEVWKALGLQEEDFYK